MPEFERGAVACSSSNAWKDQIRGLHANNAYSYTCAPNQTTLQVENWIWSIPADGYLRVYAGRDVSVNNIQYVIENRADPNNFNYGGCKHEMIAVSDNPTTPNDSFVYAWEDQANATRASMLCKNPGSTCTNRMLVSRWIKASSTV